MSLPSLNSYWRRTYDCIYKVVGINPIQIERYVLGSQGVFQRQDTSIVTNARWQQLSAVLEPIASETDDAADLFAGLNLGKQ